MGNEYTVIEVDEIGGYAKIIKPAKKNPSAVAPEPPKQLNPIPPPTSHNQRSSTLGREVRKSSIPRDIPITYKSSTLPRKPEFPTTTNVKRLLAANKRPVSLMPLCLYVEDFNLTMS
jgi:hypothetical protein